MACNAMQTHALRTSSTHGPGKRKGKRRIGSKSRSFRPVTLCVCVSLPRTHWPVSRDTLSSRRQFGTRTQSCNVVRWDALCPCCCCCCCCPRQFSDRNDGMSGESLLFPAGADRAFFSSALPSAGTRGRRRRPHRRSSSLPEDESDARSRTVP